MKVVESTRLILVKIGGGVITDKHKRYGLREEILERIAGEITKAWGELVDTDMIVGNGAGSFAHWSAKEHKTAEGFVNERSALGAGKVHHDAVKLNHIVVNALLEEGLPAYCFAPSSILAVEGGETRKIFLDSLVNALHKGMVPVVYGDVVVDSKKGSGIFSTEKVFGALVDGLKKQYKRIKIIHVSREHGVLANREVVREITQESFMELRKMINGSRGVDVTGGMTHKVEESLRLAESGVESLIVSGLERGGVRRAILGQKVMGTRIK